MNERVSMPTITCQEYELTCGCGHKSYLRLVSNLRPLQYAPCFRCGAGCEIVPMPARTGEEPHAAV